jgi:hypothetical protein
MPNRKSDLSPSLKQHFEKMGKSFQDMGRGLAAAPPTPQATAPGAGAGLGDMLAGYINPGKMAQQAGVNDVGPGEGVLAPADPAFHAFSAPPPPMPQDPRMLAYQNQQSEQLAQQAWNQQPQPQMAQQPQQPPWADPASGRVYPEPQPQVAQQQPPGPSWADAFYQLISPGLSPRSGTAGPRY